MFNNSWDKILKEEMNKKYFIKLKKFIIKERQIKNIYPPAEDLFNAFKLTEFDDIKVVILGQDPYHEKGEAIGLAFSVRDGVKMPPSLMNIFKELYNDLGIKRTKTDLSDWAKQGVFLLNTVLTVEEGKPNSHKDKGWEIFTDEVIKKISSLKENIVFILWGNNAKAKETIIDKNRHYIVYSPHPSPFSANKGFFGSKPFSKINKYLDSKGISKINF